MSGNADRDEIEKFARLADRWWAPEGPLKTLHEINPLRLAYIGTRAQLANARVLDVGCGAGILSEGLARAGARVIGIDLAEASIDVARAHADAEGLTIDYRVVSAEDLAASEPESFDVVTCLEMLEHVPDPGAVIAACARAAKPGGAVFFSTINRTLKSFLFAIVGAEYVLRMLPRGTHEFLKLIRPAELAAGAREAGLSLEELTGLNYNPLSGEYSLGGGVDVNYFAHTLKPVRT